MPLHTIPRSRPPRSGARPGWRHAPLLALAWLLAAAACTPADPAAHPVNALVNAPPERRIIETADAPAAIGPYSQAIQVGHTLYLAGQIGLDPSTGAMVEGGIEAETHRAMQNLGAVLEAAGLTFADVVQSQVFLADLDEFGAMNEIYGSYFEGPAPARATVEAARLPRDARVEILMIAVGSG